MNYLKIIKTRNHEFEAAANAFLKEIYEKGHRVFNTKYHYGLNETVGFFHCDDAPKNQMPYQRHKTPASVRVSEV